MNKIIKKLWQYELTMELAMKVKTRNGIKLMMKFVPKNRHQIQVSDKFMRSNWFKQKFKFKSCFI